MAFALLIHLQLQHLLLADVVRHHALGGALGRHAGQVVVFAVFVDIIFFQHIDELGEGRGHPHAALVLHTFVPLLQHFLYNKRQIVLLLLVLGLIEVHKYRHKGSLSIGGQQRHHLVLDGLHTAADLIPQPLFHHVGKLLLGDIRLYLLHLLLQLPADLLPAHLHKGRQVGQRDGLPAVLVAGHLRYDLGGDIAGGREGMRPLDQGPGDNGPVLQHVLQVHQVAVMHMLCKVVAVVEVDDPLIMGLHNIRGQQNTVGDITGNLTGHIVTLGGIDHRVLIGIFLLGFFVAALDEGKDLLIGGIAAAHQAAGIAVGDVALGHLKGAVRHDLLLHQVLNLLHRRRTVHLLAGQIHRFRNAADLHGRHTLAFLHHIIGLGNRGNDLGDIKIHLGAVSLNDFHAGFSSLSPVSGALAS